MDTKITETVPKSANPTVNQLTEPLHGFHLVSADKYPDGVQIDVLLVSPLDLTADPLTYTMPCTIVPASSSSSKLIFKSVLATTVAATDVWAPTAGKRFRLKGFIIAPDAGLLAAGVELITFIEETLGSFGIALQTYLPAAVGIAHQVPIVVNLPAEGYLATLADKKLQVTLGAAATAGAISITAFGTEE